MFPALLVLARRILKIGMSWWGVAAAVQLGIAAPGAYVGYRALLFLARNNIKKDRRLTCVGEV